MFIAVLTKNNWMRMTCYVVCTATVFRLYGHLNINKQLAGLSKVTEK